jgi:hypothetical protein
MLSFPVRRIGLLFLCLLPFAVSGLCEDPERVSLCELKKNQATYNHKLVEVTGFISHGFEDFTLFDPACPPWLDIWLMYGGTSASGTIYCCGVTDSRSRQRPLVIEGEPTALVDDERFREFDRRIQQWPDTMVRATVVGRFFSGRQSRIRGELRWGGYGHMGCCSLLVIQQILWVDPQNRADLDHRGSTDAPEIRAGRCGIQYLIPPRPHEHFVAAQRQADLEGPEWVFTDPRRVAQEGLAELLEIDPTTIKRLKRKQTEQARVVYQWKWKEQRMVYHVVVSRPYLLSFYAKDPQKVAWVIFDAYASGCGKK